MVVHTIVKNDPDTAKSLPAVRSRGWRTVLLLCGWARRSHPYSQTGRPAAKSHPTCRPTAPVAQAVASRFPGIQTFCSGILHSTNKRRYFQYSVRSTQYAGQVQSALSRRRGEFTRARTRRILQGLHGRAAPEVHPAAVCARVPCSSGACRARTFCNNCKSRPYFLAFPDHWHTAMAPAGTKGKRTT